MTFPKNATFPSTVTYPSVAYYPGEFLSPTPSPQPVPTPTITYHPDTISWRDRAAANGGVVTNNTLLQVNNFVEGIYDIGLRDSVGGDHTIIDLMPLAGENLASCLTKLWHLPDVYSVPFNVNFVENDYTRTTGLTGNGVDKYLLSGLNLAAHGVTNSLALGVYNRTNGGFDAVEIGVELSFPDRLFLQVKYGDSIGSFDCFDYTSGRCGVDLTNQDCTGFILGSRLSLSDSRLYRNGNWLATITTHGGSLPNAELGYYRANGPNYPTTSSRSLGLIMVARRGIPLDKIASLSTLVSNLMSAFGRAV